MNYRTVGIFAHIDSGKTTLTERILFEAGKISAMGSIEDGTTESDVLKEEIERGISIRTSFHSFTWISGSKEFRIQIVDTPGHIDFRNQVTDLLPAIQTAIVVLDGGSPVQSQARLVIEELLIAKVPMIFFINKLDRFGDDYLDTLVSLEEILEKPVSELFQKSQTNLSLEYFLQTPESFPHKLKEELFFWEDELVFSFWENRAQLDFYAKEGIRLGPKLGKLFPVYGGSAKEGGGVKELLELALWTDPKQTLEGECSMIVLSRRTSPELGQYFVFFPTEKTKLPKGMAYNPEDSLPLDFVEKGQLFYSKRNKGENFLPGQSVRILLESWSVLETELPTESRTLFLSPFSVTVEPETTEDKEFWLCRIEELVWEDPGYQLELLPDTGQIQLLGRGELHLEIGIRRILENTEKKLQSSSINIAKFERFKKMSHKVALEHRAFDDQKSSGTLIAVLEDTANFSKQIAFEVSLPEEVKHSIETAFHEATLRGFYGEEVLGLKMTVENYTPPEIVTESTLVLLKVAILAGLRSSFHENTCLVGPLTEVEVIVDTSHLGVVLSDLNRRHAKINQIEEKVAGKSHLKATASAENMLGFSGALRNMTKGIGISWERTAFAYDFHAVLKE